MSQEIRLTTTGTLSPVPIADFGNREFVHPTVDFNLLVEFTEDEIRSSKDAGGSLQAAVDAGYIILTDETGAVITDVTEASAHEHDAEVITYTPTVPSNWNGSLDPGNTDVALDQIAAREKISEGNITNLQTDVSALESSFIRLASVASIADNTAVPPTEVTGDRYILDDTGGGVNAAWDGAVALDVVEFDGLVWVATTPLEGYIAYVDDVNNDALFVNDGVPAWELRDPAAVLSSNTPQAVGTASAPGTSGLASRDDHVHAHGNQAGGLLHSIVTTLVAGFMSAADKVKLNGIAALANNYVHPNHSGDVTSAGDGTTTIQPDTVDNVKAANMPTLTIKGNDTGGVANPKDLTIAEMKAMLEYDNSETGTYTGDGTLSQAITGLGFHPKFLKVWQQILGTNSSIASYETTDMLILDNIAGQAVNMGNGKTQIGAIVALGADGFTVGDQGGGAGGNHPNRLGTIYNFWAVG